MYFIVYIKEYQSTFFISLKITNELKEESTYFNFEIIQLAIASSYHANGILSVFFFFFENIKNLKTRTLAFG